MGSEIANEKIYRIANEYGKEYPWLDRDAMGLYLKLEDVNDSLLAAAEQMRDAILPNTKGWVVAILRALYFSPNHHMSHVEISSATRVTAANLTYQVDALEKEGFVARFPHPTNRRVTLIELTPKGETICQKLVPAFGRFVSELGQTFSSDEKAKFFEFLARFQESAEAFKRTH